MITDDLRALVERSRCRGTGVCRAHGEVLIDGRCEDYGRDIIDAAMDLLPGLLDLVDAVRYQHETGSLHDDDHAPPWDDCCATGDRLAAVMSLMGQR